MSGTNFVTGVIIGRTLAKEDFGLYILGFSIILFFTNSQTSLILQPYIAIFPQLGKDEKKSFTGSSLLEQLIFSVLAIIFLILGGFSLSLGWGPAGLTKVVWTLVLVIVFILLKEYARQICLAQLQMRSAFLLDLFVSFLQIAGLGALLYLGDLSVNLTYLIIGFACGVPALAWLLIRFKSGAFRFRLDNLATDFRQRWRLGKWVFLSTMACQFGSQIYPWLLAIFHGTADAGVLAACMGIIMLANPFVLGMANYLNPITAHALAQGGVKELRLRVNQGIWLFLMIMGVFCATMLISGDRLVALVYGNKYTDTRLVLILLALSQLASTLSFPVNAGLLALKLPEVGFKSYLLALGITLTAGVSLVKILGPVGVGIGLLISSIATSAVRWIIFRRKVDAARYLGERL